MAFFSWSKTAASNATADSTIGWAEGQAPSTVNDSARAMMARTAEWRDDISGTITTGGTSTAYTVTSNQVFTTLALMNGAMIAFIPHVTNGATVTLNVDGLGAKALRYGPSLELQSGVLIQGTPYVATYVNADSAFYLQNFSANPYGIPLGALMPYIGATAPNSAFVFPFGQAISRTTYSALFTLVGTGFGVGDGTTTFNLPDLRGRAVFGLGAMGGSDAARITVAGGNFNGVILGGAGGAENHTLTVAEMPAHNHGGATGSHNHGLSTIATGSATILVSAPSGSGLNLMPAGTTGNLTDNSSPTISSQGGGTAHTILPPAMTLPYILRII